jgi:hypothetical protein
LERSKVGTGAAITVKPEILRDTTSLRFDQGTLFLNYQLVPSVTPSDHFELTINLHPYLTHHYIAYLTLLDLFAQLGGFIFLLYTLMKFVQPAELVL